ISTVLSTRLLFPLNTPPSIAVPCALRIRRGAGPVIRVARLPRYLRRSVPTKENMARLSRLLFKEASLAVIHMWIPQPGSRQHARDLQIVRLLPNSRLMHQQPLEITTLPLQILSMRKPVLLPHLL